jgi:hypothetical protein
MINDDKSTGVGIAKALALETASNDIGISPDPNVRKPRVLLAESSRWTCAHRIAIALSGAGAEIWAICPSSNHPLLKTRAVTRTLPYSALHPLDSLASAIAVAEPQLIVPCDDLVVYHLHQLHSRIIRTHGAASPLAQLIEKSLGSAVHYAVTSSRSKLLRVAHEEGLLVPDTRELTKTSDLEQWSAKYGSPSVLKIDRTWGGRGVQIARTPEEAESLYRKMTGLFGDLRAIKEFVVNDDPIWLRPRWNRSRPAITIQKYIDGRAANCGVVSWKGQVLAAIAVEAVETQGRTGPATVVRVVDSPDMIRCAERLASRLEFSGFFGLDFVIEKGTGVPYLIEMNARCTPVCHLRLGPGRDMIEALCAQLSGRVAREEIPVTQNELIAYFPQALQGDSQFLQSSYQDVPEGEPELVQMLLDSNVGGRRLKKIARNVAFRFTGAGCIATSAPVAPQGKTT